MNFIDVDNFICSILRKNIDFYEKYKYIKEIYKNVDYKNIGGKIYNDIKSDLIILDELQFSKNIYILYKEKTKYIMEKYVLILKTPLKKQNIDYASEQKKSLINEYLNIISTCIPYDIFKNLKIDSDLNVTEIINYCDNCENSQEFIKDNDVLICKKCFSEIIKMAYYNNRSFTLNLPKCNYDRTGHFKECLKQFQGKQNTFISPVLYSDLERALTVNGIINSDSSIPKEKRFAKVTRSHIMYFLKELGYSKHYDDYILIHYNLTGQKPNDITHLEEVLISDFEQISEQYGLMYNSSDRKNFINIQYILYKLLIKHNCKFNTEDFNVVKSLERKIERDKICKNIFNALGWNRKLN